MRKIHVWVGGGCEGRLVYWGYMIYGDGLESRDYGFKFLSRRDKLRIMHYLYGLRSALMELLEKRVEAEDALVQYLVKYHCVDDRLFEILSKWGSGLRDPRILEVVNSVRRLVNRVGALGLIKARRSRVEKSLEDAARLRFCSSVKGVLKRSRVWESSDGPRYVVYHVPEDSKDIPLEYLAKHIVKKEGEEDGLKGVVVIREERRKVGVLTKVCFYSVEDGVNVVRRYMGRDLFVKSAWVGRFKTICVSDNSGEEVEGILAEVFDDAGPS